MELCDVGLPPIAGGGWERCRVVPSGCGRASFLLKLDVIDEAGLVEEHGDGCEAMVLDDRQGFQGPCICDLNVVDPAEWGVFGEVVLDQIHHAFGTGDALAMGFPCSQECLAEGWGLEALFGAKVTIAGTHGEAIRFSNRVDAMQGDGQIEVANEAADDGELLEVLFAKDGIVRLKEIEELRYDGADAIEMARPTGTAELCGEAGLDDLDAAIRVIHLLHRRGEDYVCPCCTAFVQVVIQVAWIAIKIFVGTELEWVDEDAGGNMAMGSGHLAGRFDQGGVPRMQCPHGGNEDDAMVAGFATPLAEFVNGFNQCHDFKSRESNTTTPAKNSEVFTPMRTAKLRSITAHCGSTASVLAQLAMWCVSNRWR